MSDKPSYLGLLNAIVLNEDAGRTTTFKAGSPRPQTPMSVRSCVLSWPVKGSTG